MRPHHQHEDYYPEDESLCLLLKIYPDMFGSYLWQAGIGFGVQSFGGSNDLDERFCAWADEYPVESDEREDVDPAMPNWQDWMARGLALCKEFRRVLPAKYTLFYYPFTESKDSPVEVIASPNHYVSPGG